MAGRGGACSGGEDDVHLVAKAANPPPQRRGLRATSGRRQLPRRSLPEINARLARPLELGLKKPLQKSFPHIHGLYLLLRASGLVRIDEAGRGPHMDVDPPLLEQWRTLNPTERYFSLLEMWLLRAEPGIIDEDEWSDLPIPPTYGECLSLLRDLEREGGWAIASLDQGSHLRYTPGWYTLGLLDLFGVVSVSDHPSQPGEAWQIDRLDATPFGLALFSLLQNEFFIDISSIDPLHDSKQSSIGILQPVVAHYFPAWQRTLAPPEWAFREGVHIFTINLFNYWTCRMAAPGEATLDTLADTIVDAVEFTHDHLYQFTYRDPFGAEVRVAHEELEYPLSTRSMRLGDLPLGLGQEIEFLYDFGDQWLFRLTLERVEPPDPRFKAPRVLEERGSPPLQYGPWDGE